MRGDVILQLDWTIGRLMHTLDSLGIANNTLFIFTSDNGPVIDDGYIDGALENLNGIRLWEFIEEVNIVLMKPEHVCRLLSDGRIESNL